MHEPRDLPGSSCTATALGPPGHEGPHSSEEGVGLTQPLTRPSEPPSSSETARVSGCPRKSTRRAGAPAGPSHAESTPGREEAGAHPILPAKPPGGHACLSCLPPGCPPPCGPRVPTLRTTAAWIPVIGPGGAAPRGTRGPSSNRPLLPGPAPGRARAQLSCLSLEPRGTSQVTLGLWSPGNSAGPVSSNGCQPQPGHKYIKYETKTKYVFSIKAQLSCLPDQVLMNARPRTEGRAGRRVGGRGLLCPPKRGKGGDRTTREPVLV